jgi:hypothetical protein
MPSYFPPAPWKPPEDDGPTPLLMLEQQYAAQHQEKAAARASAGKKARLHQEHQVATERTAALVALINPPPAPGKDR